METRGEEYLKDISGPVIYAGWHSILPFILYFGRKVKMATMASLSDDGGLIAPTLNKLGFEVVRGSTGRGGVKALRGIFRLLKQGYNIGLPIDGSRGPARKVVIVQPLERINPPKVDKQDLLGYFLILLIFEYRSWFYVLPNDSNGPPLSS